MSGTAHGQHDYYIPDPSPWPITAMISVFLMLAGGALAVREALRGLVSKGMLTQMPKLTPVAAISVGVVEGRCRLDLDYREDSTAEVDANFVMTGDGRLIEVQGSAEGEPFERGVFDEMLDMAWKGIGDLLELWKDGRNG